VPKFQQLRLLGTDDGASEIEEEKTFDT